MQAAVAPPQGIQPGRGGFMRSIDGKPYVTDPTGATVKSGPRKGEIKRLPYGSPSNRGMQIENSTNLTKWGERRVVLGVGLDTAIAAQCAQLAGLDVDSDEYKTLADAIIVKAKEIAKANLAADKGTHVHALTEDSDESRDWVQRAEAGEILGLDREMQDALVAGWNRMLARDGLEVLAVEASVVDDAWRLAGTLDRIVRTSRPLRFVRHGGEIADIPAGTVLVLDVKTSNKRLDDNGCVQYWNAYSIQIASYAQSVPYDTQAETRGSWPFEISQTHALIAHPDLDTTEWELIYVDLTAGREHGGECVVTAKAWEARTDVFSIAQVEVESQPDRLAIVNARATLTVDPSQGADLAEGFDELWAAMYEDFTALPDAAKLWRGTLVGDAARAHVPFHVQEVRTERTYHLNKGIIALAAGEGDHDEILRALLALILGEVAYFPGVLPGHALGSLDATQAEAFAGFVDAYFADGLTSSVDPDGHLVFAA